MKNEGFRPPKSGLLPLKMKVMSSHGSNLPGSFCNSATVDITVEPQPSTEACVGDSLTACGYPKFFTGGTNPGIVGSNIGAGSFKGKKKDHLWFIQNANWHPNRPWQFVLFFLVGILFLEGISNSYLLGWTVFLSFFLGMSILFFQSFANSWIRRLVCFWVPNLTFPKKVGPKTPMQIYMGWIHNSYNLPCKWGLCNAMLVFTGELTELKVIITPGTQDPQTIIMKNRLPHQWTGSLRPCKDERPGALLWDVVFIVAGGTGV